jgi:hypothetical protein
MKGGLPTKREKMQCRKGFTNERRSDDIGEFMGKFGAGIKSNAHTAKIMSSVFLEAHSDGV